MDLVTPDVGLLFWTFCSFAILYFLLKKFAWKPILGSVNDREDSIREALLAAENAKKEMENLKSDNEKILKEAPQTAASNKKLEKEFKSRTDDLQKKVKAIQKQEKDFKKNSVTMATADLQKAQKKIQNTKIFI